MANGNSWLFFLYIHKYTEMTKIGNNFGKRTWNMFTRLKLNVSSSVTSVAVIVVVLQQDQ